jgi:hypothetical protein
LVIIAIEFCSSVKYDVFVTPMIIFNDCNITI